MKLYKIFQPSSGHVFGIYPGSTSSAALAALARDAHYYEGAISLVAREVAEFSLAAQACIEETASDPAWDAARVQNGDITIAELRSECLTGADHDRVQGWHDYTNAIAEAVASCR